MSKKRVLWLDYIARFPVGFPADMKKLSFSHFFRDLAVSIAGDIITQKFGPFGLGTLPKIDKALCTTSTHTNNMLVWVSKASNILEILETKQF